jgi:hypothetical protein
MATSGLKGMQQGNSPSQQTRGAQKRAESGWQIGVTIYKNCSFPPE